MLCFTIQKHLEEKKRHLDEILHLLYIVNKKNIIYGKQELWQTDSKRMDLSTEPACINNMLL